MLRNVLLIRSAATALVTRRILDQSVDIFSIQKAKSRSVYYSIYLVFTVDIYIDFFVIPRKPRNDFQHDAKLIWGKVQYMICLNAQFILCTRIIADQLVGNKIN